MRLSKERILAHIKPLIDEIRGRNVGSFMIFLLISCLFWVLMALNDDIQRDFEIPVKLENVPADVTLLTSEPSSINLTIKDKGSALIRYSLGNTPQLTFNFEDIAVDNNRLVITRQKANNAIRNIFGQAQVMALNPDSLSVPFTRLPPKTVRVKLNCEDVSAAPQFTISGKPTFTPDTVRLYSARPIKQLRAVTTEPVIATNLKDTTTMTVRLITPEGTRAIPPVVTVTIPVEPLILTTRTLPIITINVPQSKHLVLFPPEGKVNYLIPMSVYNSGDKTSLNIIADFARRNPATGRMPLSLPTLPKNYQNPTLLTDSVEYLIDQH